MIKTWLIGALVIALAGATLPHTSEAKRLGSGKSSGMQRDMPARTAPDAPPAKPATPQQANPAQSAAPGAAAAPAAAAKRSWMGPIAGLAAGLGLAALMSHLGFGEAFANFLMLALLAVAGIALVMFLLRRFGPARGGLNGPTPALAGAGGAPVPASWNQPQQPATLERRSAEPPMASPQAAEPEVARSAPAVSRAFVPAAFDSEGFGRIAKMIFIRMQAANDTADLDDLRKFTTPELFASLRLDLQERGPSDQHTDVVAIDAEVLDVANEADRQVVSVRFHGQVVEERGGAPVAVNEVWHLVKPHDDSRGWAIAGIEQVS
jgi:predicted lipid-binding transport protein (Tim44 family)